jgi:prevent-host-death family protein
MKTISAFEAKTHLAALLDRVVKGEKITITRHGIPAAMLMPVQERDTKMSHQDIVQGMRDLRKRVKPGKMSVRKMVNEGRRLIDPRAVAVATLDRKLHKTKQQSKRA